ncbi:hypothetical protein D1007_00713 [Hordeum vulgare]|nr:hypothetical protein D1007_00713 [Hordeum vulgare]
MASAAPGHRGDREVRERRREKGGTMWQPTSRQRPLRRDGVAPRAATLPFPSPSSSAAPPSLKRPVRRDTGAAWAPPGQRQGSARSGGDTGQYGDSARRSMYGGCTSSFPGSTSSRGAPHPHHQASQRRPRISRSRMQEIRRHPAAITARKGPAGEDDRREA